LNYCNTECSIAVNTDLSTGAIAECADSPKVFLSLREAHTPKCCIRAIASAYPTQQFPLELRGGDRHFRSGSFTLSKAWEDWQLLCVASGEEKIFIKSLQAISDYPVGFFK